MPALDPGERAADRVDLPDLEKGPAHEIGGEALDEIRAAERVDRLGDAGFLRDDLLGPQRDAGGLLTRERERLVIGVRMERLRAAEHRGERFDRGPDDVVARLLRSKGRAHRLGVKAQGPRLGTGDGEAFASDPLPDDPRRAELRDLLDERRIRGEEERELPHEGLDRETAGDRGLDVGDRVREGERELLHRVRPGLADVIAGDRDGVPARKCGAAVLEDVGDQTQRRARREDVGPAGDVLLQDVVLDRPAEAIEPRALLLGHGDVHREEDRRGRVDRHRRRHLFERDPVEEPFEIGERGDRDADLPHLPGDPRIVRVVAHLGREIERHREPGLAVGKEVAIAGVRFLGRAEAGVLPHRPEAPPVHRRLHAAGERRLTGKAPVAGR